jgi:hypothetical protein
MGTHKNFPAGRDRALIRVYYGSKENGKTGGGTQGMDGGTGGGGH